MPQYTDIFYTPSYVDKVQPVDTVQVVDTLRAVDSVACDSLAPSFITSGFDGSFIPLPRMSYDVFQGWNLALLGLMLLLIVLNKQLYPRQFRQLLSVPGGVSHTNQLLREWNPQRSFICVSFMMGYILLISLFLQKSCVVLSHDVPTYNVIRVFGIICAAMTGWVLLRFTLLHLVNWLFDAHEAVDRQITVLFSVSIFTLILMVPLMLLLLYNPSRYFVWIGVGVLGLAALVRLIIGIVETRVATKMPSFYIFLYFCALEIAPVATLVIAGWRYFSQGAVF